MAPYSSTGRNPERSQDSAYLHLAMSDPLLASLMQRVGPHELRLRSSQTPFQALMRSIVSQQLSTKAAAVIHARARGLFPRSRPSAKGLSAISDEALRNAGLSRAKVLALRSLAARTLDRTVPGSRELGRLDDESIIERLTLVRGIGAWSAQMLLIFHLGRPDVLPATDLGVRRGFMLHRGEAELPHPSWVLECGEKWRPYRSVASWYLWRANELDWPHQQ